MPQFKTPTTDLYQTLGIDRTSNAGEIKKAYRKLARQNHPDMVDEDEKVAAAARFREATAAYECLSDPSRKAMYDAQFTSSGSFANDTYGDLFGETFGNFWSSSQRGYDQRERIVIPDPENIVIDGVPVTVRYFQARYSSTLQADLYVEFDAAWRLSALATTFGGAQLDTVHFMVGNEEIGMVDATYSRSVVDDIQRGLRRFESRKKAVAEQAEFKACLESLRLQRNRLHQAGRPVARLDQLIADMYDKLNNERRHRQTSYLFAHASYDSWMTMQRTIEHEIDRIKDGGSQLLVDGLINGSIYHPDAERNKAILRLIEVFTIRSGGEFAGDNKFDEAWLWQFYTDRVGDVRDVRDLAKLDLLIPTGDYVIEDEAGFDFAPEVIVLKEAKRSSAHAVSYSYRMIDGQRVPVGHVTVPYRVYNQFGCEYGKRSGFPTLPYGIHLWVMVTLDGGTLIASGFDDEQLRNRVEKARKSGKSNITNEEQNRYSADRTPAPPWAKGQARRGSRR